MTSITPAIALLLGLLGPVDVEKIIPDEKLEGKILNEANFLTSGVATDIYQYVNPNTGKTLIVYDKNRNKVYDKGDKKELWYNNGFYRNPE